ncbi:MAG: MFS transporter [Acidimicrobiales bacterium]
MGTVGEEGDGAARAGALRTAWRHHSFRYLLASYAVSAAGDFICTVALVAYVLDRTGSATWVAALAIMRILPFALFGSLGGVLAGRVDRRRLMVVLDLVRAGAMVAMAGVVVVDGPVVLLLVLMFASNAAATPYRAAVAALTPDLVGEDDLAAANASEAVVNQVGMFAGPALGAAIYAVSSAEVALLVNGLTFAASAGLVARAVLRRAPATSETAGSPPSGAPAEPGEPGEPPADAASSWLDDLRAGWAVTRATPGVVVIFGLFMATMLAWGFEMVLYPLVAVDLGMGAEGVGYLTAAVGIGGVAFAPLSGRFAANPRPGMLLAASGVLLGAPMVALAVVSARGVALAVLLLEGVGNILLEVVAVTTLQRLVRGDDSARVFGTLDSATGLATLAGVVVAPLVAQHVDLSWGLVLGGAPVVLVAVAGWSRLVHVGQAARDQVADLQPIAEHLGRLGLFEGVGPGSLERLAAEVIEEHLAAGSVVVREGEPADDLYVILTGAFEVRSTGAVAPIPDLGPDEWFGEIGVLHRVPRTATVTATAEATVWRIGGVAFAEAVSGAGSGTGLHTMMGLRLARTPGAIA